MPATDRKHEILEVATDLLLTRGFNGFSYQDLSERLGITKASIHHHFATKEALGIALCDQFEALYGEITSKAAAKGEGPRGMVDAMLEFGAEMAELGDRCCPGGVLQAEYSSLPPGMRARVDELFGLVHRSMTAVLEEGRKSGQFAFEGDAGDQAWHLMAAKQGALLSARVHGAAIYHAIARQIRSSLYT